MDWSRRSVMQGGLATAGGLWIPRPVFGAPQTATERKFLFIFCPGGWDQSVVFAPAFGSDIIETEDGITQAELNGITFVNSLERPNVASFFQDWGSSTCLINGFESRSVAHDVCLRLAMTGTTQPNGDDWAALIANEAGPASLMPLVHLSGPSYTFDCGESVVRVGSSGQLPNLLDGTALEFSDMDVTLPTDAIQAIEDQAVVSQAEMRSLAAAKGRAQLILSGALDAELRLGELQELSDTLNLGSGETLVERAQIILDCFRSGVARCGMVAYDGIMELGWDTHASNQIQSQHFDGLFSGLSGILSAVENTTDVNGAPLADSLTVVVLSEMGRYPQFNVRGGREHWTYTSGMLIGSGVRGGQVIGGYDDYAAGQATNLDTGQVDDSGEFLVTGHVGATLLSLADMDPAEHLSFSPIRAALVEP